MRFTKEEVTHIARLSSLSMDERELSQIREDLSDIMEIVAVLEQLQETEEPLRGREMCEATREDTVQPSVEREHLLANAAVRNEQGIVVPQTVE